MPVYSHSRLATYETCPLQYKYSYVEKVELEPRTTLDKVSSLMICTPRSEKQSNRP